jgi:hypothetical protein
MTEAPSGKVAPPTIRDKEVDPRLNDPRVLAWFEDHVTELRRDASGQRILFWGLAFGFVVGLAAHVGGYLLKSTAPPEPLGLLADLLYTLGWALWTGAVVVVFVQIVPEAKRRQIKRALDAYEAAMRDKSTSKDGGARDT